MGNLDAKESVPAPGRQRGVDMCVTFSQPQNKLLIN